MENPTTYHKYISQQDTDFTSRASIATIISEVLSVAGQDADSKGFGVGYLNKRNLTWVLSRFAIEILELPQAFEKISVRTWISDVNRIISTRNFVITNSKGEKIAEAVSQWSVIDIEQRRATDLTVLFADFPQYILGALDSEIARPKKIPVIQQPSAVREHRAMYSDIDFNRHVNAIRYIDMAIDMLPLEKLTLESPLRVDLQYIQESYNDDLLTIIYQDKEPQALFEIVKNDANSPIMKAIIEWK